MKRELIYLKEKFSYLQNEFDFKIIEIYKANTYFYITWSNGCSNLKICYEFTDENPIGIYFYAADDLYMYSHKYFKEEVAYRMKSKDKNNFKDIIEFAAGKVKKMIVTGEISVD